MNRIPPIIDAADNLLSASRANELIRAFNRANKFRAEPPLSVLVTDGNILISIDANPTDTLNPDGSNGLNP